MVPSIEMAKQYLEWNDTLKQLAQKYWPGPLTVVGHYKLKIINYKLHTLASDHTLALRVTADPWLQQLTTALGRPLVATSANHAGQPALYDSATIKDVFSTLDTQPDILVDGGVLPANPATTLVSVVSNKSNILRQGEIVLEI